MADICYTDAKHKDIGVIRGAKLDLEYGDTRNDFELALNAPCEYSLVPGAYIYIEDSEWGGVIDSLGSVSKTNTLTYKGRSWHGILADKILEPDSGQDYLKVSGDAHTVLKQIVSRLQLRDVFSVSNSLSNIEINYSFDRYCNAYEGIRKMLKAKGARLDLSFDSVSGHVELSAKPIIKYYDAADSDLTDVKIKSVVRPYNHLICLGKGELKNRIVRHFYADKRGNISTTQTLFGIDERSLTYDYSNAEEDELVKGGMKKLKEYQQADIIKVTLDDSKEFAIDDVVVGTDILSGLTVAATVGTKIVVITDTGCSISYKAGGVFI